MKNCPNCDANVDGLLYQCDCCGYIFLKNNSLFIQHVNTVAGSGDLAGYLKDILDRLNSSEIAKQFHSLDIVTIEVYCYPKYMVKEYNIKDKNYVSLRKKKAILTRVVCYEEFITLEAQQKAIQLSDLIKECLLNLYIKVNGQCAERLQLEINSILG